MKSNTPTLDAYGHLNWTVGNEDWIACFDAIREGDRIHYHVVVNCESGGFVDTPEEGYVALADANGIANLKSLPNYWADICIEHYLDKRGRRYRVKVTETRHCAKSWAAHLDALISRGPCSEDDTCGECEECCDHEGFDPIRDGWVGSDGLP